MVPMLYCMHYFVTIVTLNVFLGDLIDSFYHTITCENTTPFYLRIRTSYRCDFLSQRVLQAYLLDDQKTGALTILGIKIINK